MAPPGEERPLASSSHDGNKLHLLSLPSEILETIFKHAGLSDLFNLSLVCKPFHELASEHMYRKVNHVFANSETYAGQRSLDRLIAVLETLNTSDHNYSRHVKAIALDSVNAVDPKKSSKFKCGYNCGRFLNSLLVSTVNKTIGLETFKWDADLEVTHSLFLALSKIQGFQNLHVRLHMATAPVPATNAPSVLLGPLQNHHQHFQSNGPPYGPATQASLAMDPYLFQTLESSKSSETLSLFTGLKSFFALDPKKNAANETDTDSSSDEEDFITLQPPPGPSTFPNPGNPFGMPPVPSPGEENTNQGHKAHENALSQIFGLDLSISDRQRDQALENSVASAANQKAEKMKLSDEEEDYKFVRTLQQIAQALPLIAFSSEQTPQTLRAVEKMEKATTRYLEKNAEKVAVAKRRSSAGEGASSSSKVQLTNSDVQDNNAPSSLPQPSASPFEIGQPGASLNKDKQASIRESPGISVTVEEIPPELVDMDCPDLVEDAEEDQEFVEPGPSNASDGDLTPTASSYQNGNMNILHSSSPKNAKGKEAMRRSPSPANTVVKVGSVHAAEEQSVEGYIRENHGIPLESLSICLIPLSPLVIIRAVDVRALKHLSLLNVGAQRNLWAMLEQLHYVRPCQLTSIHTDDVTPSFLSFVNSLDKVTELFMLERRGITKPEPFASKTPVKIDDIRKQVFEKHLKHLQRLMIRNDDDANWALDVQAIRMLTSLGSNLIEMAIGLNMSSFHYFLQQLGGLRSLKALQVFYFHPDMCNSMLRELRTCIINHILHFRFLRTEYVAMCYSLGGPTQNNAIQLKTKLGRVTTATQMQDPKSVDDNFSSPGTHDGRSASTSPSEMEVFMRDGIKVTDIAGVKMWEKEIWALKL
ncbi:hypothetical protein MW887_009663 [Aspergillus wentii]|nr:hypothetical protein MW887_009663 [Aspergillus wentii]